MQDVRCKNCNRLLAKYNDSVLHIKASKHGEQVYLESGRVHFVCPSFVYTENGKIKCEETTRINLDNGVISVY